MAWLIKARRLNRNTQTKETYYRIGWRDEDGRMHTRAIGFCDRTEAQRLLRIFEGRLAAGEAVEPPTSAPGSPPPATPQIPTLADYLDSTWLPVVQRDKAPRTHRAAVRAANQLKALLGRLTLDRIDYAAVDGYLTKRRKLGRKSRTLQLELWCLKGALQHAANCEILPGVPNLPRVRLNDTRPHRYLTADESERLLAALRPLAVQPHEVTRGRPPITRDGLSYLAVLMALNTGMRKGEILSRGWEDIVWTMGPHGTLIVRPKPQIGFRMKTGHDRAIPLTPQLAGALQTERARVGQPTEGWIFPSKRDPSQPRQDFKKALARACGRVGLPAIHPHGLRHTWASRLAMAGVDRRTLMELGGWKVGQMLDGIYAHVTDAHKASVMARMGITDADVEDTDGEE